MKSEAEAKVDYSIGDIAFSTGTLKSKIIVSVFCLVIAGIVAVSVNSIVKRRSMTAGLSPEQVVQLFYEASTEQDIETMNGCINLQNITAVNNRHIPSALFNTWRRFEEFYHGGKQIEDEGLVFTPAFWKENGSPELRSGQRVEGVSIVSVKEAQPAVFTVNYDLYYTLADRATGINTPESVNLTDTCYLTERKGQWIIDRIVQHD